MQWDHNPSTHSFPKGRAYFYFYLILQYLFGTTLYILQLQKNL